jgi:hypothetical protein
VPIGPNRRNAWPRAPPAIDIFSQALVLRDADGWQITNAGRTLLASIEMRVAVYRIHGTNRPDTIGTAVSSGCFRLVNTDVSDLYERVPVGTKVIIRQKPEL